MKILHRALRYLLFVILLAIVTGFLGCWWIVHRALPQLDGVAPLPELKQEATVDRDIWGVPHIRARSLEDLVTAQGYVMAQDRLWQMDLLRRVAAGELSEIFGLGTLPLDRQFRTSGLRLAAERDVESLDPELRGLLEAYARGVNRYIQERQERLPFEFVALRYAPRPWRPADSLLIAAYMYQTLTNTWEAELKRAKVTALVGPDRAKDLFVSDSPLDHFILPDVASGGRNVRAKKRQSQRQPRSPGLASPQTRASWDAPHAALAETRPQPGPGSGPAEVELWVAAEAVLNQFDQQLRGGAGSNNWVVDGRHTASGKPLLANDTHLPLDVPCIWYMIHLTAPGWNVKGFALPGAPLVIIGHNDRIAWGFTNNGADVQDLYIETFNPTNPLEYRVNGKWIAAQVRKETIHVRGRADEVLDIVVTRHGPIVHREAERAYALRWTATEPGGLDASHSMLGRAQNWQEFKEGMRHITGPAQNAVYADVDGNIGFIVAARIPVRKNGDGSVPIPGDTDAYEWTGYIPFDELPQVLNPPGGIIATANARVVGPAYPHYLTDRWESPYRTERIYQLLANRRDLRPTDCIAIQTDIVSLPDRLLAEQLLRASQTHEPKDPQTKALIARLGGWDGRAQANSIEMTFIVLTVRALSENMLRPYLGGETQLYVWPRSETFLENALRRHSPEWLPKQFGSYEELLIASADQAVAKMRAELGQSEQAWRWGRSMELEILHPLGRSGLLRRLLSVGPIEQGGTGSTVKRAGPRFGQAMRFVADLGDFNNSLMNLTLGESGQYGSRYYRDQFRAWFEGRGVAAPFTDAAEERTRVQRLRLLPATTAASPRP